VTGARFGEVDLDLLADYLVGELDEGARARIAGLIDTDPTWAEAYRQLGVADEAVAAELRAIGATPEPMPADVVAGIDRALRNAALDTVISLEDHRRRRQRRYQFLAAAAACVLVAFGGSPPAGPSAACREAATT
jgi:anti-sigma factor RsiW